MKLLSLQHFFTSNKTNYKNRETNIAKGKNNKAFPRRPLKSMSPVTNRCLVFKICISRENQYKTWILIPWGRSCEQGQSWKSKLLGSDSTCTATTQNMA